jgi:hypothetical protein
VVGEATSIGELLTDMAAGIVHEQAVEDVGRLACCCGDYPGCERCVLI